MSGQKDEGFVCQITFFETVAMQIRKSLRLIFLPTCKAVEILTRPPICLIFASYNQEWLERRLDFLWTCKLLKPKLYDLFCEFRGIFYLVWQRHKTKWFWKNVKPVGSVFAVFALIYLKNHLHHHHHVGAHVIFRPCHVHHHQHYRHHSVDSQVHHGQPGDVHRAADAVQADVRRHRPHWKVREQLTKNWADQNMLILDENSSFEGWANSKASPTREWKWFNALK